MKNITYEFVDLDTDESFQLFGKTLGGVLCNNTLHFDNPLAKGELIKATPDDGLWIRKWKFTVFENIVLHKLPTPADKERKLVLIYFLNPAIFDLKNKSRKIGVNSHHNNIVLSNNVMVDFTVMPKQPFFVMDVAFSASWLLQQFADADTSFTSLLHQYLDKSREIILMEPCSVEEYKILHELETSMLAGEEDVLFIRSRIYKLICSFFSKMLNREGVALIEGVVHYEQVMQAEAMLMENIKKPPKIATLAKSINMSVSSLLRQFKLLFGKSVYEYHVEKKMELAKRMLLENRVTIKGMAEMLGYKQVSPFIESFTKHHGYSPGTLKALSSQPSFS
ncbi:MAG: helix-turn-helix transcriptional regulator [Flavisolibacter sp.]|nr:helix-turn-helix transcriptional regulator [Flavisolibacter sp.]